MIRYDAGTTNPVLLDRLGDWGDHEAWVEFITRYDPAIRLSCCRYHLDDDTTEELCQRVWIELTQRMRNFRYDPGKSFRGWLRRLCQSRSVDLLREKKAGGELWLEEQRTEPLWLGALDEVEAEDDVASERPRLLHLAEQVQDAVRRRVKEQTWQIFWNITVLEQAISEVSRNSGVSYYAAFAAQKRVHRMLREEGQKLLRERRSPEPEVGRTGP